MSTIKEKLRKIIIEKDTRICLAADVNSVEELVQTADLLGPYICVLKIHYDIIPHFIRDNCGEKLVHLAKKHNFLIWEDRKYADIGAIMEKQIRLNVLSWADIVSVHGLPGLESISSIPKELGIILIGELSCYGNILSWPYTQAVLEISAELSNFVGFVGQRDFKIGINEDSLMFVPGIGKTTGNSDGKGQRYSSIRDKSFADVYVIGRGILGTNDRVETIKNFIEEVREIKNK